MARKLRIVNGFSIHEEVESNDWQRDRLLIVGFSGDGKQVHVKYIVNPYNLHWLPIGDIQKKSDEPKWWSKIEGYTPGPTPT